MGLFDKLAKKEPKNKQTTKQRDVIDIAMDNLRKYGIREEDTLEYAIDNEITTHRTPLTTKERKALRETEISRGSRATQKEVTRIYIRYSSDKCVSGIDTIKLGDILIDCYNNKFPINERVKLVKNEFDLDNETAKYIVDVVMGQSAILTDWAISKDRGASCFTIYSPYNDKYDGQKLPIKDLPDYLPFMIENNASPIFHLS